MEGFKIRPAEEVCATCRRTFEAGEQIFSAIQMENDRFTRTDTCISCRPEQEPFCSFTARAPLREVTQLTLKEEVREFFKKLEAMTERSRHQQRLMYLSALWLSRKKTLKLVETIRRDGQPVLRLQKAWDGETLELPEEPIPDGELPPLLEELGALFHLDPSKAKSQLSAQAQTPEPPK